MKKAVETKAVQTKGGREKRRGRRGVAWLLSLCLIFALCPVGQAATVAELTAQLEAARAELASVKSQLATDYPNCVSVNGKVVSTSPLVVKVMRLTHYDYYVVKTPVEAGYYLFGMMYSCYHKLTNNTTVVYDEGVAHNATIVGTGYLKGKELRSRQLELEQEVSKLEDELEDEKKYAPLRERSDHLNALKCVREPGVRLIFKVGNPYMVICGVKREAEKNPSSDLYASYYLIDGKQVFYATDEKDEQGGYDYGAYIEDGNLNGMPVVIDGSTMIPVRPLIEWLGGTVNWDSQTNAISCQLDGATLSMTIGSATAYVNGEAKEMPVPVTVYGGKTVIPLRFAAENLGYRVEWLQEGQYIRIYDKEEVVTPPATEVAQEPQYDWSNFAGDWVCEEEQYHLHIPDGGDNQTSTGTFRCDEIGWGDEYSVTFWLNDDGTVSGHGVWDFIMVDCYYLQPGDGGLSGTVSFPESSAVKTVHFVPDGN